MMQNMINFKFPGKYMSQDRKSTNPIKIEGYTITKLLGAGTFAHIVEAEKNGQLFALKIYRNETQQEQRELISSFSKEVSANTQLSYLFPNHPRFVKFFHTIPASETTLNSLKPLLNEDNKEQEQKSDSLSSILVLEHCSLGNLDHFISDPNFSLSSYEAFCCGFQLVTALSTLHQNEFLHHDLFSRNILVTYDESKHIVFKIGDFGLLKRRGIKDQIETCPSSALFRAPEMEDKFHDPFLVEVYLLGILLAQLFFKDVRVLIKHYDTILDKIFLDEHITYKKRKQLCKSIQVEFINKLKSSIPNDFPLSDILLKMLHEKPNQRYSAQELEKEFLKLSQLATWDKRPSVSGRIFAELKNSAEFQVELKQENRESNKILMGIDINNQIFNKNFQLFENEFYSRFELTPDTEVKSYTHAKDSSCLMMKEISFATQLNQYPSTHLIRCLYTSPFRGNEIFQQGIAFIYETPNQGSLAKFASSYTKPWTPYEVLNFTYQISDGLKILHDMKYSHNVTKTIYVTEEDYNTIFKIGDLHLAKLEEKKEFYQEDIYHFGLLLLNLITKKDNAKLEDIPSTHLLFSLLTLMMDSNPTKRPSINFVKESVLKILTEEKELNKKSSSWKFTFAETWQKSLPVKTTTHHLEDKKANNTLTTVSAVN